MAKKFPYVGLFVPNCIVSDSLDHKEELLKESPGDKRIRREVEFYQRFPPGLRYNRLLAHKIAVYGVNNHEWKAAEKIYSFPVGELEKLVEVDLGEEFMAAIIGFREQIDERKAEHVLPDGTMIRGERIRMVPGSHNFKDLEAFLEIKHNLEPETKYDIERIKRKRKCFEYQFRIKKEELDIFYPREFHIEKYHKIGDEYFERENFVIVMAKKNDSGRIHLFRRKK